MNMRVAATIAILNDVQARYTISFANSPMTKAGTVYQSYEMPRCLDDV
jgi:hypothetical protein